jgi:hypothetical protein
VVAGAESFLAMHMANIQVDKFYTADGAESVTPIPQKRNADSSGA